MTDEWTEVCRQWSDAYDAWRAAPTSSSTEALDIAASDMHRACMTIIEASRQRKARFVAAVTGEPIEVALARLNDRAVQRIGPIRKRP